MGRQTVVANVVLTALLLSATACGASEGTKTPTPTKATTSPTSSLPVQPQGSDGVTYDVLNWTDYAQNPIVGAYKVTNEAYTASINRHKVLPGLREGVDRALLRKIGDDIAFVKKKRWHLPPIVTVRVRSVRTTASKAVLTMCVWRPSNSYYGDNDKIVGPPENWWDNEISTFANSGGRWVLTSVDIKGRCPGGAPPAPTT
jgi:hypothetical protein